MGVPPGSHRRAVCQFVAYQPEKAPLSRRTIDCRAIFCRERIRLLLPRTHSASWNTSKAAAIPDRDDCTGSSNVVRAIPVTSGPRDRVRKHDLDQRAGAAAGLDLEFGAVGFDERLGQRQADSRTLGPVRWRRRAERLESCGNLVVVEAM